MKISKAIKNAISEDKRQSKAKFLKLQDFYSKKLAKGVAIKKEYTIPLLDKQERNYYETYLHN